jgi:hypothetical protein
MESQDSRPQVMFEPEWEPIMFFSNIRQTHIYIICVVTASDLFKLVRIFVLLGYDYEICDFWEFSRYESIFKYFYIFFR